jgi:hypothetical protein
MKIGKVRRDMKCTMHGVITEIRKDGLACVKTGPKTVDVIWTQAKGSKVGEKVTLINVKSVSFSVWVIANDFNKRAA